MPLRKSVSETEIFNRSKEMLDYKPKGKVSETEILDRSKEKRDYKSEGKDGSSQPQTKAEGFPVTYCPPKAETKDEHKNKQVVGGSESCIICGGAHSHIVCGLQYSCPIDQKVGDGFVVVCVCNNVVIDGKCPKNCGNTWGQAGYDFAKHDPWFPKTAPVFPINLPDFQKEHKNN